MKHHKLPDMIKGWFVGGFKPSALYSNDFEVGIKHYQAGDEECSHVHQIATELTAIVSGKVWMMGKEYGPGDIITVEPGEVTDFKALENTITVVVKTPSLPNDKYIV